MIETPRAALRADEIAEEADFFSFGTNDLTQMTFGFSRDDVESRMMPAYLEAGPAEAQPVRDDRPGRGRRARAHRRASEGGRRSRTSSSACAASTAATPSRSQLFYDAGLDYVSLLAVPGADRPAGGGAGRARTAAERCSHRSRSRQRTSPADVDETFAELRRHALWEWVALIALVTVLLLVDLLVLHREAARRPGHARRRIETRGLDRDRPRRSASSCSAWHGGQAAGEYYAGYLIELSLSASTTSSSGR